VLPDAVGRILSSVRTRLRIRLVAQALTIGGAVCGLLLIGSPRLSISVGAGVAAAAALMLWRWRNSDAVVARLVEARHGLDNLLVTAIELNERPRPVRAEIRDAILQQASERAAQVEPGAVVPIGHATGVAASVLIACALLARADDVPAMLQSQAAAMNGTASAVATDITARVEPPAYTKRNAETHSNPTHLTVLSGSSVRVEHRSRVIREWVATASESLNLRIDEVGASRFLLVTVVRDQSPVVRVTAPGRDTAFANASMSLPIEVDGLDDLGLTSLTLRYTKASGGGENVTFTEGEVPLALERADERRWRGKARWSLESLDLADGDVLVYRAVGRDTNPQGEPVESDAFLIEIGKAAGIANAGFALPTEERKYAISQQMVIYKTERLLANRAAHAGDWLEQTRMLGVEQRMVRAEVVFLSGGEVQDEVEEAAHSHELAEGRLENPGRAEMVRALNFMSRAEAQLNDGNAAEALVFERQALASLERALDRRRYFLRTLPDRSRIDTTRRLTGERAEAHTWTREQSRAEPALENGLRALVADLAAAAAGAREVDAPLAARVAAIDPQSPAMQQAAIAMASAGTGDQRRASARTAMDAVSAHALARLPGAAPIHLRRDPLAGRLAQEIAPRPER
jgi:hypothetical protein